MLKIIYQVLEKTLVNTGFNLFDPFEGLKIPQQLESKINLTNRSYFSTTVGLALENLMYLDITNL